jgi:uncharacterized protein (TIGR02598 family)
MKSKLLNRTVSRLQKGFSLVEVTIATGITAVAMTTLLGLIPHGLGNLREAGELGAHSRIARHIFGTLANETWRDASGADALSYRHDRRRFIFNDQASVIESERPDDLEVAYVAEVLIPEQDLTLPAANVSDPFLRRVTVRVATVPNAEFDFDSAPRLAYRSQSTLIARTGP